MTNLKRNLVNIFDEYKNIDKLVKLTTDSYRPHDPGLYLYNLICDTKFENRFTEEFIELTYTTLIAWNMNQRGAKLSDFEIFKNSIISYKTEITELRNFKLGEIEDMDVFNIKLKYLFEKLELVGKDKPKLVTFSKTLHFFLQDLLMPVDRTYTLFYFFNNTDFKKENQFSIYWSIFEEFNSIAKMYDFRQYIDKRWNRNIPKVIDNIIIAYVKENNEAKNIK